MTARRRELFLETRVVVEAAGRRGAPVGDVAGELARPVLAPEATQLGIKIDRAALDLLELGSVLHPFVDPGHDEARGIDVPDALAAKNIAERVEIAVDSHADAVAGIGRAKDRQDEVGTAILDTPAVEGLAEIAGLLLEPDSGRDIEDAGDPRGAVHQEAPRGRATALDLGLKHVIDEDDRLVEIGHHVANRGAYRFGNRDAVELRDILEEQPIENAVEFKNMTVQRLERIIGLLECGARGRVGRRRRAARREEGSPKDHRGSAQETARYGQRRYPTLSRVAVSTGWPIGAGAMVDKSRHGRQHKIPKEPFAPGWTSRRWRASAMIECPCLWKS